MQVNYDQPPKISIVMATFNGGKYLQEQLDSFLAQTRLPDELVIIDDCSTDNTLEMIQAFAATAPFEVRWEQNEKNLGYTGNFNQALIKTTGDLVLLSDQDDVWFPEKLERMERYALGDPKALVVMNDAALTDGELNDTGLTKQGQIASAGMTDSSFVMGCCAAVRRELLDICLPIPSDYKGHDNWIIKIADGIGRKLVVPDILQWYRRHEANESHFIANRTTKVTRGMVWRQSVIKAFQANANDSVLQLTSSCEQAHLLLEGVQLAAIRASGALKDELLAYARGLQAHCEALDCRRKIRISSRLKRLLLILQLWRENGYSQFSGLKSAFRDVVFR